MSVILRSGDLLTFSDDYLTEAVFDGTRSAIVESTHIERCDDIDILTIDCRFGYLIHMPYSQFKDLVKAGKIVIQSA